MKYFLAHLACSQSFYILGAGKTTGVADICEPFIPPPPPLAGGTYKTWGVPTRRGACGRDDYERCDTRAPNGDSSAVVRRSYITTAGGDDTSERLLSRRAVRRKYYFNNSRSNQAGYSGARGRRKWCYSPTDSQRDVDDSKLTAYSSGRLSNTVEHSRAHKVTRLKM